MNSLLYLARTGLKNTIKEILHKPGKLIMYILLILLIGGGLLATLFAGSHNSGEVLPLFWLKGIFFALLLLFLVMAVQKGLTSGDTIFDMSDVNLLFTSPVNPRTILLYGLVRLAKVSFWASFFILFQSSSLSNFGVGFGGILLLFGGFMLHTIVLSVLSLVIYSLTNGRPRRKWAVRGVAGALLTVPLAYYVVTLLQTGDAMGALEKLLHSPLLDAVPFSGWTAAGAIALMEGRVLAGLLWWGLLLLAGAAMVAYITFSRVDYYEDVLVATETAFEKKRAVEEGDMHTAAATLGKAKVGRTGLKGQGASVFFYKHLRETFRENRFGFFNLSTLIMGIGAIAAAVFLRGQVGVLMLLQIIMWMEIFRIGSGRGMRELFSHYIFMVPEPPLKKLLWANLETVFKTLLESVLFLGVPGVILGDNPLVVLMAMLTFTLFALLLLGLNFLSMRWGDIDLSQGLMVMLYFLLVLLIMLPGLVPALVVGFMVGGSPGTLLALLILAGWELLVALVFFGISRNILHTCDMFSGVKGK